MNKKYSPNLYLLAAFSCATGVSIGRDTDWDLVSGWDVQLLTYFISVALALFFVFVYVCVDASLLRFFDWIEKERQGRRK